MLKSDDLINKVKVYNKFLNPKTLTKAKFNWWPRLPKLRRNK